MVIVTLQRLILSFSFLNKIMNDECILYCSSHRYGYFDRFHESGPRGFLNQAFHLNDSLSSANIVLFFIVTIDQGKDLREVALLLKLFFTHRQTYEEFVV